MIDLRGSARSGIRCALVAVAAMLLSGGAVLAQSAAEARNAVSPELLGSGGLVSPNYEREVAEGFLWRAGYGSWSIEQEPGPPAQGVSPASDAERIRQRVKQGQQVRITDDQGQEWRGRISALAADRLTVVTRDRQPADISYASILRIDRPHDSLANGALIGLVAGATLGLLAVISEENRECDPGVFFSCGDPTAAAYVGVPAVLGGLGTALGVGIDALIRRDPNLYRRAGGARMTVVPALGHGTRGFSATLRW